MRACASCWRRGRGRGRGREREGRAQGCVSCLEKKKKKQSGFFVCFSPHLSSAFFFLVWHLSKHFTQKEKGGQGEAAARARGPYPRHARARAPRPRHLFLFFPKNAGPPQDTHHAAPPRAARALTRGGDPRGRARAHTHTRARTHTPHRTTHTSHTLTRARAVPPPQSHVLYFSFFVSLLRLGFVFRDGCDAARRSDRTHTHAHTRVSARGAHSRSATLEGSSSIWVL